MQRYSEKVLNYMRMVKNLRFHQMKGRANLLIARLVWYLLEDKIEELSIAVEGDLEGTSNDRLRLSWKSENFQTSIGFPTWLFEPEITRRLVGISNRTERNIHRKPPGSFVSGEPSPRLEKELGKLLRKDKMIAEASKMLSHDIYHSSWGLNPVEYSKQYQVGNDIVCNECRRSLTQK